MASAGEPAYFAKARQVGRPVVKDQPKFDLDAYIANYRGMKLFPFIPFCILLSPA